MNDMFSFNTEKLAEVLDELNNNYNEYVSSLKELDKEITTLGTVWKENDKSVYNDFKEKYQEKKIKLLELESFIKSLIDNLSSKNDQLIEVTRKVKDKFE